MTNAAKPTTQTKQPSSGWGNTFFTREKTYYELATSWVYAGFGMFIASTAAGFTGHARSLIQITGIDSRGMRVEDAAVILGGLLGFVVYAIARASSTKESRFKRREEYASLTLLAKTKIWVYAIAANWFLIHMAGLFFYSADFAIRCAYWSMRGMYCLP